MPGIVGLLTRDPRPWAEAQLLRMVESMRHESFYKTGTWIDEALGLYVGWVEREGPFADGMPLRNENGDVVLVFSGEEFPEPGTARRLKERGHRFEEDGCSYLVHLAEEGTEEVAEEDAAFPSGLNGQFHGILADRKRGTVTLFNDRYGMHRTYYHEATDAFYFAAEAKAILAVRPELRSADARGLGELVACGCVLEDRTLFTGLHLLPIASAWVFRGGAIERKGSYFSPREWEEQAPMEAEPYYREIRGIFERNLARYFNGPGRIGLSLTGGLDTRMILAWRKPEPGSLPCYTFAGSYRECRDVRIARHVAAVCGQHFETIPVGAEFLARFPHYAERTVYLTDGCAPVNHSPDLYVNELARQIAPIRMTGNYGDQVLRHMCVFRPGAPAPGLFRPEFLAQVAAAGEAYGRIAEGHALTVAAFRQAPWHYHGLLALESSQVAMRTPYIDNELVRALFRAPAATLANNDMRVRLIGDGSPELRKIRTDLGFAGGGGRLAAEVSRRFHRFTMSTEYAYDYGMPQWVAGIDHRLSFLHLERIFLGRHKFTHFRVWYRDALANYVREMLLDSRTLSRPYLERDMVEKVVKGHLKGDRNHTTAIHKILTLEHFHRLFIDAQ
jgi:asparagine synthase (glutamine-hydrolysing)